MKEYLGIELGSTRIKAVVIGERGEVIAAGSWTWENRPLDGGIWTYDLGDVPKGLAAAYGACADDYAAKRGRRPARFDAMGVSAMMHGYLAFDRAGTLLAPFRTWRSTNAAQAGAELSALFGCNVPMRWSVAQLYQSVLGGAEHVGAIDFQTTLAGYVHFLLTGRRVLGINDASGMFPIDAATKTYDARRVELFRAKTGIDVTKIFPEVLVAGDEAGTLTEAGARLLDSSGALAAGVPLCPPEGDAGTGMVATNAIRPLRGNVSVGTSVFAMMVLERSLANPNPEVDIVSTPSGDDVAMVHSNNGCGELDRWVALFGGDYEALFNEALKDGEPDCGGVRATNWISAEPSEGVMEPNPYVSHLPAARLTRANLMRAELYAVFATLAKGMDLLRGEGVVPKRLTGHGGFFTVPGVGQQVMADTLGVETATFKTAGAGGAWGIAVLAAYGDACRGGERLSLADYLDRRIFAGVETSVRAPDPAGQAGFRIFCERDLRNGQRNLL